MTTSASPRTLRVALDAAISPSRSEAVYVITTLLETAGYAAHFVWAPDAATARHDDTFDIYYGPRRDVRSRLAIPSSPWEFRSAPSREVIEVQRHGEIDLLRFDGEARGAESSDHGALPRDIVFASYWLLTGARESTWPRSRWDDLKAGESLLVKEGLLSRAPVSRYAALVRRHFESLGVPALRWPWEEPRATAAFAFTHDVDYPEIIRWIEVPRTLLRGSLRNAWGLATGRQHFWRFRDWIDLTRRFGTRPTFYFMARRGSLLEFMTGTPDTFYDVRSRRFRQLFLELKDAGAEVGLHASFGAYRSADILRAERERIESVAQVRVLGNLHHYWHMNPSDPNETLQRHEEAGFLYDSSLGLEYYPGWRRGMCHPFRPYSPAQRRSIATVQVPPAWMDDHFDRRRSVNHISDADAAAKQLLDTARSLGGTCVVDYHARGMNADFFPRYGPWLARFVERELPAAATGLTAAEIAQAYTERSRVIGTASRDETLGDPVSMRPLSPRAAG